jgi:hypothetical protein
MSLETKSPIFIVGCPRSGTTLLQSLLASHPQIASFPESHFFVRLIKDRDFLRRALGIAAKPARIRFEQFLHEIAHEEMQIYLPKQALFMHQYTQAFLKVLDRLTEEQGKSLWIEKTPDHLFYIDNIEKLVSRAKFIHIIRNGADVVASLYEVTQKYSEIWHEPWDIDRCINKWIDAVKTSYDHIHKPNHILVSYEQLIDSPEVILEKICNFLGILFEDKMLQQRTKVISQIVLKNEQWKTSVSQTIKKNKHKKFYELFDEEQRSYIVENIAKVNIYRLFHNH